MNTTTHTARASTIGLSPTLARLCGLKAALLAALLLAGPVLAAPQPGKPQQLTSPDQVPDGLAKSDWASIRQAYEAGRHAFQPIEGGWQARNPGQQWTTKFDGRGFLSKPREGDWTWGLELMSYGFGTAQMSVGATPPAVKADGQRLTYQWDANVQEWWVNDQRGLEHGYVVKERPSEISNSKPQISNPLSFTFATRGGLVPKISDDAKGVLFQDTNGATVVNYTGLKVWDADGKVLASRFEAVEERGVHAASASVGGESLKRAEARAPQGSVRLLVDEAGARYPITIDPIAQQAYVKPSTVGTTQAGDQFGGSVAVSGDTVVVGAPYEASSTRGINSTPNESDSSSGAAYVFVRSGTNWSQQAYLKPASVGTYQTADFFGYSVAVSGDTVVVGAYGEASSTTGINSTPNELASAAGAAYVFVRSGTNWSQQAYLKASQVNAGDGFGWSVAASDDTVVIGATSDDSSTTGINSTPNESASGAGSAYVFVRSGTNWSQQAYLKAHQVTAGDLFGHSVAVSGDTVVVGALGEDSSTTGINSTPNESASDAGAAYVFVRSETNWIQQAYLKADQVSAGDQFGYSVAVSGDTVVVGSPEEDGGRPGINITPNEGAFNAGAAYVFGRSGTTWNQDAYLKASQVYPQEYFGRSVAVSNNIVVVGAYNEYSSTTGINSIPNRSASSAGAAYIFGNSGLGWVQQAYLKPGAVGTTQVGDLFGVSVAVSGDTVVVGAHYENSSTTTINSTPNESANDAGAAYIFSVSALADSQIAVEQPVGTTVPDYGSKSFGIVTSGGSKSFTFTITNSGGAFLSFWGQGIAIDGPDAAMFVVTTNASGTIWPGSNTTFTVRFTPTSVGVKTAKLTIYSTAFSNGDNVYEINLTGTGHAPEMDVVKQPEFTSVADGGTVAFGVVNQGSPVSFVFTIRNLDYGDLTGLGITINGTDAAMFTVTSSPTAPVAANDTTTFTVRFAPTSPGAKTAALHIANNDSDENPYDIILTGTGTTPEMDVQQPAGTSIADGGTRNFGMLNVGANTNLTFTITNTGNGDLAGLGITIDGANAAEFSVIASPTAPVAANGSTTFTVRFAPTSPGAKTAALHIANNDSNENPYDISLTGSGPQPEMDVHQPAGTSIADFGSMDFGSVNAGTNVSRTFTITNTGNGDLTGLGITIDGADAAMFAVTASPTAPVAANGSTTFTVRFAPTSPGIKTAVLHIANNDSNENPYDIIMRGTGIAPEIEVWIPAVYGIPDGGTRNLNDVRVGGILGIPFVITNSGNTNLTGLGITLDGPDAAQFSVIVSPTAPVPTNGSTTFTVLFAPTSLGTKTATLHITSNDPDESPYDITLSGWVTPPLHPAKLTTLVDFADNTAPKGSSPYGDLMRGSDGNFYGMTSDGGSNGSGTVFKMTAAGVLTTLVEFAGDTAPKGSDPYGSLVQGTDGNFYGMTQYGGANGKGTVFQMTPAGVLTTLVEFAGNTAPKGSYPYGSLVQGADGNFYGMTVYGGSNGVGTVFKMTAAGVLTTLVEFAGNTAPKGSDPYGSLMQGADGNFYGMTSSGGANSLGTVFQMTPAGVLTTLVEFAGNTAPKGSYPYGSLVLGTNGNFYGMTYGGGAQGAGTVFQMTPAGVLTTLAEIADAGGANPEGSLVQAADGNFYGMTPNTVFRMTPAGVLATLVEFDYDNGADPKGSLVQGTDGSFYGMTSGGGADYYGTVFKLEVGVVGPPEIAVEQPVGTGVADGGSRNFGPISVGAFSDFTFTITNSGGSSLNITNITLDGVDASQFSITDNTTASVAGWAVTTVTVRFMPTSAGVKTAALHVINNDADEGIYDINLTGGLSGGPEIAVKLPNGSGISDGGGISFGDVAIGASASFTFTITNSGSAALTGLGITVDGADAARFTITTNPAASVVTNGSTTFTVRFTPTSPGTNNAVLHLASNDDDENPYDIALIGTGAPSAMATSFTSGVFSQTVSTSLGWIYALEYKTNLAAPTWTALPGVAGTGGSVVLSDTGAPTSGRFYRLRATPVP